jgi:hypothetical protein
MHWGHWALFAPISDIRLSTLRGLKPVHRHLAPISKGSVITALLP